MQITDGAVVSIAHHLFRLNQGQFEEYVDDGRVNLTALHLAVTAGKLRLLDDISFNLDACSLLAILGPTGAGKSTVMRVLTGTQPPAAGTVAYNGRNLYAAYDELRYRIGYVPQDDILHGQLSVRRALSFAAKLRFPPDVSAAERDQRVDEVMAELGLIQRGPTSRSASSPAASANVRASRWSCSPDRRCCRWTSRPPAWIRATSGRSWCCCAT